MGNVLQAGQGQNPARQALIYAGVPKESNAFTINKVCASGLKAVALAAQAIAFQRASPPLTSSSAPTARNMSRMRSGRRRSTARWPSFTDVVVHVEPALESERATRREGGGLRAEG